MSGSAVRPPRLVVLGCGYVGTALAHAALARGWTVSALTRNAPRAAELEAAGVTPVVVADLAADGWPPALDPAGAAIVNCVSPSSGDLAGYQHSFVGGMHSVRAWLEKSAAAGRAPARDFLFTSATSVYPQTDGGWVGEDAAGVAPEMSPAGIVLREAEEMVLALPGAQCERRWVLRLGGIYGPGRHAMLDALRAGQRVFSGSGDDWMNLIHRDDAAGAILACLEAGIGAKGGVCNIVDDTPVRRGDLLDELAGLLGVAPGQVRCDAAQKGGRSSHRQLAAGTVPNRRISNTRLKDVTGWRPLYPSFRQGYRTIMAKGSAFFDRDP